MNENKFTLYISGMHCASCSVIVSDIFTENTSIKSFSLNNDSAEIEIKDGIDKADFIENLNRKLGEHNYHASFERVSLTSKVIPTIYGILIGVVALVVIFFIGKKLSQSGFSGVSNSYLTALIIGFIASVSTCAAIVGGIVMSIASAHSDRKTTIRSLASFHVGRVVGFAILGALLGAFGSLFNGISQNISAVMLVSVGVIMFYFGLKNIGVIKASKSHLSDKAVSFIRSFQGKSGLIAYGVLGSLTFFVPCGFTQSMQALSLSSGSVLTGLLTMLSFVIGTTPVLAFIGFGFGTIKQGKWSDIVYVAAGVVIIGFAFINIAAGLALFGIIQPLGI